MKNQLLVRSLLVDPITKKYIKAVDEQDFSDFIQLLSRRGEDSGVRVFNFSSIIDAIHRQIDKRLKHRENTELSVKRNNVFNGWKRIKSIRNDSLLNSAVVQICSEAEDALNWMHTRLPKFKTSFLLAKYGYDYRLQRDDKRTALLEFSDEIEAFIEVLLCTMHSMLLVDPGYFKDEDVYVEHCHTVRSLLVEALCSELGYRNGKFAWNSFIHQCVMEPKRVGINADALMLQIGSEERGKDIERSLVDLDKTMDFDDGTRGYVVKWSPMSSDKIEGVKVLSRLLQEIDSIFGFLNSLSSSDLQYDVQGPEQDSFEQEVRLLLTARGVNGRL